MAWRSNFPFFISERWITDQTVWIWTTWTFLSVKYGQVVKYELARCKRLNCLIRLAFKCFRWSFLIIYVVTTGKPFNYVGKRSRIKYVNGGLLLWKPQCRNWLRYLFPHVAELVNCQTRYPDRNLRRFPAHGGKWYNGRRFPQYSGIKRCICRLSGKFRYPFGPVVLSLAY